MNAQSKDWHGIAVAKLNSVLGPARGPVVLEEALRATGLSHISSADELHRFAQALITTGGFAGAVGGLLSVHAVMHGASGGSGSR
ncbi:hypothetical protein D7X74_08715 [Corallococcus sp. CA047B]|uniref:hypothetical protein n=1 Tax=Corallococcus sp. CA047B TaxID=2316729 RepID=UPI000EA327DB|nr:hypothetical protein [Corallococcus sp. CA047B]RKH18763.1 hypothetical protein D7X74_08715 [Corallococcus sp. CA047B]